MGGKVLAIPRHAYVGVLLYRTDLLRRYGYREPPKTWDELEMMATRIQAGERARGEKDFWGYLWQGAIDEDLTCNGLEWQISEGGGRIIEDTASVLRSQSTNAKHTGRVIDPSQALTARARIAAVSARAPMCATKQPPTAPTNILWRICPRPVSPRNRKNPASRM